MLLYLGFGLLVLAALLLWWSRRQRRSAGLPAGRVVYTDPKILGKPEKPLYDGALGLAGRPDYLVEGPGGVPIPVEVKSASAPPVPHEGHRFQLLAYCLLVHSTTGRRPPYGLLRYRNRTFAVDYTPGAEGELRALIEQMRTGMRKRELPRSHEQPGRCARCGYRQVCDQRL